MQLLMTNTKRLSKDVLVQFISLTSRVKELRTMCHIVVKNNEFGILQKLVLMYITQVKELGTMCQLLQSCLTCEDSFGFHWFCHLGNLAI